MYNVFVHVVTVFYILYQLHALWETIASFLSLRVAVLFFKLATHPFFLNPTKISPKHNKRPLCTATTNMPYYRQASIDVHPASIMAQHLTLSSLAHCTIATSNCDSPAWPMHHHVMSLLLPLVVPTKSTRTIHSTLRSIADTNDQPHTRNHTEQTIRITKKNRIGIEPRTQILILGEAFEDHQLDLYFTSPKNTYPIMILAFILLYLQNNSVWYNIKIEKTVFYTFPF